MANNVVLGILELAAILSCGYGMYQIYYASYKSDYIVLVYNALWFIFGLLSNLSGLLSIGFSYYEIEDEVEMSHFFLQHHFLLAWFAMFVGYPTLVSSFWLIYYPSYYAHIPACLAVLPVAAWILKQNRAIAITSQGVSGATIAAHAYICYLANNRSGMIGAVIMIFNVVSLSLPTRYNLLGLTPRESFIVGLSSASYILSVAVAEMANKPTAVKTLMPW